MRTLGLKVRACLGACASIDIARVSVPVSAAQGRAGAGRGRVGGVDRQGLGGGSQDCCLPAQRQGQLPNMASEPFSFILVRSPSTPERGIYSQPLATRDELHTFAMSLSDYTKDSLTRDGSVMNTLASPPACLRKIL